MYKIIVIYILNTRIFYIQHYILYLHSNYLTQCFIMIWVFCTKYSVRYSHSFGRYNQQKHVSNFPNETRHLVYESDNITRTIPP